MAELLKLLESQDAFKSDMMEALLSQSLSTHANITGGNANLNVTNINKTSTTSTISTITTNMNNNSSSSFIDNGNNVNRNITGASNETTTTTTTSNNNINDQFFFLDPKVNRLADMNKVLREAKESVNDRRRLLIDEVTDQATEAHMTTTLNTNANIREANERIARQQQSGSPSSSPDMSKMPKEPSAMMKHFLNSMVPSMERVVDFSKKLPGFLDLDTEDQVTLIKQGMFEVMLTRISLLIDPVNETMIDPSLKMKKPRAMVRKMPPLGQFIDQFFEIAKKINPLSLTDGENGLFMAILMLCPDRKNLKNVSAVHTIQQLYLQALYQLMRHNHQDVEEKFTTLISTIPTIRKVNDEHFRFTHNMKRKSTTEFESIFPQLHRELFDTTLH